jgi:hypothetical protein
MFIQAFFEGIIAALGALVLELSPPIFGFALIETTLLFLLFTATVEEIIKYIFIYNHYSKLKTPAQTKILASAFFIGAGFAFIDIFFKLASTEKNVFLSFLGILLVHLFTTTILGVFFLKNKSKSFFLGVFFIGLNILLHFCYNFLILSLN